MERDGGSALSEWTRESFVAAVRALTESRGRPVSQKEFLRENDLGSHHLYKLFPDGGWSEVLEVAGLPRHPNWNQTLSDEDLLAELHRVLQQLNSIPSWAKLHSKLNISAATVRKRFGGWEGTLQRYRVWLKELDPSSALLALIPVATTAPHASEATVDGVEAAKPATVAETLSSADDDALYGAPIDFRGLRHAPINEQGVVYLFGMPKGTPRVVNRVAAPPAKHGGRSVICWQGTHEAREGVW